MATVTRYVNTASTAGGDGTTNGESGATRAYASLNEWEANEQTNLVSAGDTHVVKCSVGSGSAADTTKVSTGGWTTDASNYITIEANTGQEAQMPWDNTIYRLVVSVAADTNALEINDEYTVVNDLQIVCNGVVSTSYTQRAIAILANGDGSQVHRCILRSTYDNASDGGAAAYHQTFYVSGGTSVIATNCFLIAENLDAGKPNYSLPFLVLAGSGVRLYNCTAIASDGQAGSVAYYQNASGIATPINCIGVTGSATLNSAFHDVGGSGWGADTDYNASEDTTAPGSNSRTSQTFTFAAAGDYHLDASDTGARTFGTDLSGDATYAFSDDFDGDTRVNWDIGADEDLDAAAASTTPIGARGGPGRTGGKTYNRHWGPF